MHALDASTPFICGRHWHGRSVTSASSRYELVHPEAMVCWWQAGATSRTADGSGVCDEFEWATT